MSSVETGAPAPHHDHVPGDGPARRLKHFVHQNGRKIYIASTPEEHARLVKQLSHENPESNFDVLIHGTPEALYTIRELHTHNEARRENLRLEHGELYEQFEKVKEDLDHLSSELNKMTEHGVSLDANFSKFGYSAHLRTEDDSASASLTEDDASSITKAQSRTHEGVKFFKRPVIRQYFHKGLLWRSSHSGEVGTFELFADLLYVGIIDILGARAVGVPTGRSFVEYVIHFCMAFKIWNDLTLVSNWFEQDDIIQKFCVLFYLVNIFGYTTNIAYAFEANSATAEYDTYIPMMSFYLIERIYTVLYFTWLSYVVPTVRGTCLYNSFISLLGGLFWIASVELDYPYRLPFIFTAIIIDLFGSLFAIWLAKATRTEGSRFARFVSKWFDFYPAVNIEHRTERTNAFVSLIFGYSVLTILYQSRSRIGVNAFLGKGILGLVQAFAFQWIYFEIDHDGVHVHAIRRHWLSGISWITVHLPFVLSYALAAATLSKLVLAHDCSDTDANDLGIAYQEESASALDNGLRWYYCGGIGVALFCMGILSFCHIHKTVANPRLKKRPRLFIRACMATIIICLPLAKNLSSLQLISTTTGLVALCLIMDLFGNSCVGDKFWTGGWCEEAKKTTSYEANVSLGRRKKQELMKALYMGEKVGLKDLMRTQSNTSDSPGKKVHDEAWQHAHI